MPGVPSGAENFMDFLDQTLRPWIKNTVFPNVQHGRDAIYGHSFCGLFTIWALITRPKLFDTFFSASPAIFWNGKSILTELGRLNNHTITGTKPAYAIGYGSLEQFPVKRRTETQAAFNTRKSFIQTFEMTDNCQALYNGVKNSPNLRDVKIKEYKNSDHFAVGGAGLFDGYEYFIDW